MSADKENAVKGRGVTVKGLAVAYGEKRVFDGFDIAFPAGEISVVMGGSGVGKSTLLDLLHFSKRQVDTLDQCA